MFNDNDIAEVLADEIGYGQQGGSRTSVTVLEDGHAHDQDTAVTRKTVYHRTVYTAGDTTYRDINVGETVVSVKYNSAGHQVNNAYTY